MIARLSFIEATINRAANSLPEAVIDGLSQSPKTLPCRFFYDDSGSELFEKICEQPEYYPTRTEHTILENYADSMIRSVSAGSERPLTMIELGSGSSYKTRLLMEAALRAQGSLHYVPIDISGDFLYESATTLLKDFGDRRLTVTAIAAEYHDALTVLPAREGPRLFLFLGSNIGNFSPETAAALLTDIRHQMLPEDRLLVGVDLVKDQQILEAAYDDSAGITADFNRNLLTRINREMEADFDLTLWEHRAVFNADSSRMEMWLISRVDQFVTIPREGLYFTFKKGEGIHTENSHKYTGNSFATLCHGARLKVQESWTDSRNWFASILLRPGNNDAE